MRNPSNEMNLADLQLFDELHHALSSSATEPPESTRVAVQQAVAALHPPDGQRHRWAFDLRHKPWLVALSALGVVLFGTGTAFAAGVPIPSPIRNAAYALHLPIAPQSVVNVRNTTNQLRHDLAQHAPNPQSTAQAAKQLASQYHQLNHGEQSQVGAAPNQTLLKACQALANGASGSSGSNLAAGIPACAPALSGSTGSPPSTGTSGTNPSQPPTQKGPGTSGQPSGSGGSAPSVPSQGSSPGGGGTGQSPTTGGSTPPSSGQSGSGTPGSGSRPPIQGGSGSGQSSAGTPGSDSNPSGSPGSPGSGEGSVGRQGFPTTSTTQAEYGDQSTATDSSADRSSTALSPGG